MHKLMMGLAKTMAVLGGSVLSVLILLTCLSVIGRILNGVFHGSVMTSLAPEFSQWMIDIGVGPINGDFELVEAGVAFAIFAFIPLCQITAVDIFADQFPRWLDRALRVLTDVVFALVLILIAWRLYDGMLSKLQYGETTYLIQFPIWWAYAASLSGAVLAAVIGIYVAVVRIFEVATGHQIIQDGMGQDT